MWLELRGNGGQGGLQRGCLLGLCCRLVRGEETVVSGGAGGSWHCMEEEKFVEVPKVARGMCCMRNLREDRRKKKLWSKFFGN